MPLSYHKSGISGAEQESVKVGGMSDLGSHHRDTLDEIFGHPASGNVEWREVLSLLEAVGTVEEEHNGKIRVTVGDETEVLQPLANAGLEPTT
jgi:hypothetical protein